VLIIWKINLLIININWTERKKSCLENYLFFGWGLKLKKSKIWYDCIFIYWWSERDIQEKKLFIWTRTGDSAILAKNGDTNNNVNQRSRQLFFCVSCSQWGKSNSKAIFKMKNRCVCKIALFIIINFTNTARRKRDFVAVDKQIECSFS